MGFKRKVSLGGLGRNRWKYLAQGEEAKVSDITRSERERERVCIVCGNPQIKVLRF
jgi:hypothetical protein